MEVLKVTAKAEEHDLPKGTKIVALTDNSGRTTYVSFEGKKKPEDMERLNSGRNVLKVPDKCTSFTILGEEEFNIGVDFIQSSEEATTSDLLMEALEARVTALEAEIKTMKQGYEKLKEPHPPAKHNPEAKHHKDDDDDHSTKGYAARKK